MASPRKTRSQGPAEDIDLDHPAGGAEADALVIGVPPPTRLEKELAFYSSYHRDGTNKAIHFVFVPALCISGLILLDHLRLADAPSQILGPGAATQLSAGLVTIVGYCAYYIYLDPIGGALFLPIGAAFYLTTTYLTLTVPEWLPFRHAWGWQASALPFGTYLFLGSWVVQFIGHGVFERRAPALLDNLAQALVLAPFFVFLEGLFSLNYKPALAKRVNNLASQRVIQMNRAAKVKT